jgi:hypothetical protein
VTGPDGTPTGTVTFVDATTGTVLGTAGLDSTGVAQLTTNAVPSGSNTVRADYSGDGTYLPSSGTTRLRITPKPLVAVGSAAGGSGVVAVYDPQTGTLHALFVPFGYYPGGVRVATGDVNGDGYSDVVVLAGPGPQNGHIKIYSGFDFSLLADYTVGYPGDMNLAVGDVNGDGKADVILSTATSFDYVAVLSGASQNVLAAFSVFGGLPIGVTVAAGDFTGTGRDEILAGTATGYSGAVVIDAMTQQRLASFLMPIPTNGVSVAMGDVNGDGRADAILGTLTPVPGVGPIVGVYDAASQGLIGGFAAFPGQSFGVRVSTTDRNGDGRAQVLTGFIGPTQIVAYYTYLPGSNSFALLGGFLVPTLGLPPSPEGLYVGGSV